ncbi:MAG TPA: sugar porter family MFS transporter [Steroidobacteraceae bacterium]|nr:sugar porter family MFS transporter [Steroidobacteraceae bacterium]
MLARAQLRIIGVASLAGLLFGFDTAVIAGATQALRVNFDLSPAGLGMAVAAALWGTLCGALFLGKPGDRFGSRTLLRFIGALYAVAAIGSALAWSLSSFVVFRFAIGIAIGGSSVLAPVYIAELSPAERRGSLVSLFQVNIVAGILLAYVSNFALDGLLTAAVAWRLKFAVAAVPSAAFLAALWFIPHSPRWLISQGREQEATASLVRLGDTNPVATVADIVQSASTDEGARAASLSWRLHRWPIMLAVGLALFNQLSGINAILYYLGDIFRAAGFGTASADAQSIAVGLTNLIGTLIAMSLIDRVGRRRLLLIGSVGMAIAQFGVAAILWTGLHRGGLLWLLMLFVVSFAISQGAVIWVYLSEIFPTPVRARGQSLGSATHWLANAVISSAFPMVAALSQAVPFACFGFMMALQFGLVLYCLPETKGVVLEHMEAAMHARARASGSNSA